MGKISVIGVDGFHNSGKTTQLGLLKSRLEQEGVFVVVRRGDGSRKGEGGEIYDPESVWWKENRPRILAAGFEGKASHEAGLEASNRINRELYYTKNWWMPHEMEKVGVDKGVLLVDRGLISRLFVHRRFDPDVTFSEISKFGVGSYIKDVVIPDITLLFHAPREILLERNLVRLDGKEKKEFNSIVFNNYYDEYERHLISLPPELENTVIRIDTSASIPEVHRRISEVTFQYLEGNINRGLENPFSSRIERF